MNSDFDNFLWHDNKVYSIAFPDVEYSIKIDIDFIIEWVPKEDGRGYNFLVAPAILIFEDVSNLSIEMALNDSAELFIEEVKKTNGRPSRNGEALLFDYTIMLNAGQITFTSTGFGQDLMGEPQLGEAQTYNRT